MSCPVARVGRGGIRGIARRDVEISVGAEFQRAAVMPAAGPGDENLFARRIATRRDGVAHPESRYARAVGQPRAALLGTDDIADVAVPVFGELGMERQSIGLVDDPARRQIADLLGDIQEQIGMVTVLSIGKRKNPAMLLDDEPAVASRCDNHLQRVVQLQLWKHPRSQIRRRRFRCARDVRGRQRQAVGGEREGRREG